jgi:hypothetical protein
LRVEIKNWLAFIGPDKENGGGETPMSETIAPREKGAAAPGCCSLH